VAIPLFVVRTHAATCASQSPTQNDLSTREPQISQNALLAVGLSLVVGGPPAVVRRSRLGHVSSKKVGHRRQDRQRVASRLGSSASLPPERLTSEHLISRKHTNDTPSSHPATSHQPPAPAIHHNIF
jgi:hypothetical protein